MGRSVRATRLVASVLGVVVAPNVLAQVGGSQLMGRVVDASTHEPVPDAVVTATSPQLQGHQAVLTDAGGNYRIPQLGRGTYTLRFAKKSYQPYVRDEIELQPEQTLRLNVELLPETLGETVTVDRAPTVDVGSTATGTQVSSNFIEAVPLSRGLRTFGDVALVAPGVQTDFSGIAISGATSPENHFLVDGLSTNNVLTGLNGSPVSIEFIDQVNVITGGFMPEYGRATGGTVSAFTKSGGNEFHGSVWGTWTPGALQGATPAVVTSGATFSSLTTLYNRWDVGATLGGYIIKDRLWFFAGFNPSQEKFVQTRVTNYLDPDLSYVNCQNPDGTPNPNGCQPAGAGSFMNAPGSPFLGYALVPPRVDPATGYTISHPISGTAVRQFQTNTSYQYIAKVTFLLNPDQRFSLSVLGQPNQFRDFPDSIASDFMADQAHDTPSGYLDLTGKWTGAFLEKRLLVDVTAGWHSEYSGRYPTDGSEVGSTSGLAGQQRVLVQNYHSLTELGPEFRAPVPSQCTPITYAVPPGSPAGTQPRVFYPCPVSATQPFVFGGPGGLSSATGNDVQVKGVVTYLANWLGSQVLKAGIDVAYQTYGNTRAWSGGERLIESAGGGANYLTQSFGVLVGPDEPRILLSQHAFSRSISIGGFIQDSWSILNKVTLNLGIRYDAQSLYGADGQLGLNLPNQWSPRIGVIWDPTQRGRSKLYANYGRYYENVPLSVANNSLPGYPLLFVRRGYGAAIPASARCNPIVNPTSFQGPCSSNDNVRPQGYLSANAGWSVFSVEKDAVDPDITPQSSDEFVVGGEYEVLRNARLGATFTRRWMNKAVEDMSNDNANTFFLGNPGYGIASNFPRAVRNYTAVTVYFTKSLASFWQAQVSYTYQSLTGNYEGLIFTDFNNQLNPNLTAAFDLRSLLPNSSGRLPGNITSTVKAFGSYDWVILPVFSITFGGAYIGKSGAPYGYLGANSLYGSGAIYILPRGNAGTLPWVHEIDLRMALSFRAGKDVTVTFACDVFNVLNGAQVVAIDQNYTYANVLPLINGTAQGLKGTPSTLRYEGQVPYTHTDDNLNFGRPTAYQPPRSWRFSARVAF